MSTTREEVIRQIMDLASGGGEPNKSAMVLLSEVCESIATYWGDVAVESEDDLEREKRERWSEAWSDAEQHLQDESEELV